MSRIVGISQERIQGVSFRFNDGKLIKITLTNSNSSPAYVKSITTSLGKGRDNTEIYTTAGKYQTSHPNYAGYAAVCSDESGKNRLSSPVEVTGLVDVQSKNGSPGNNTGYFFKLGTDPYYRVTFSFEHGKLIVPQKVGGVDGKVVVYVCKIDTNSVTTKDSEGNDVVVDVALSSRDASESGVTADIYLKPGSPLSGVSFSATSPVMFGDSIYFTNIDFSGLGLSPDSTYGYQCSFYDVVDGWLSWTYCSSSPYDIPSNYRDTVSAVQFKVWVNDDDYETSYHEVLSNVVNIKLNKPSKSLITPNPISIGEEVSAISLSTSDTAKDLVFEHHWLNITDHSSISTENAVIPTEPCYHQYRSSARGFISSDYSDPSDNLVINYSPRNMIKYGFDCSFSSKSRDDVKSLITQDFIFVPTNDIEVSWSSFPLNLHQGQFNRYIVKIVDVENVNAPETVYSTEWVNDCSKGKSVTISGILGKIKNNEMTPGHHFEVKLECWYYNPSKGIVDDLQGSDVVGTNIITSKRFLLAGFPDNPDILYPDSSRSSNLTLNKQPRVIFTCKNPDYLPRSICQIKSATVSYNLGIERKSYNVFVDYDGDGNPVIRSSGSSSNFLSVKNGEGEELVFVFKMDEISDYSRVVISITCTNTFGLTCQTTSVAYISYKNFEEVAAGNKINASDASSLGDYCIESVRSYQRLSRELPQKDIDYYLESKVKYSYLDDQGLEQGPFSKQEFLERVTEGQDFKIINTSSEEANVDVALSKVPKVSKADVSLSFEYNYKNKTSQEVTLTKDAVVNVISTESKVEKTRFLKLGYSKSLYPNYPKELSENDFSISEEGYVSGRTGDCHVSNIKVTSLTSDGENIHNLASSYTRGLVRSEDGLEENSSYITVDFYPFDSIESEEGWGTYEFRIQLLYLLPPNQENPDKVEFSTGNFIKTSISEKPPNEWHYASSTYLNYSYYPFNKKISVTQYINSDMVLLNVSAVSIYSKTDESGNTTYKDYEVLIYSNEKVVDIDKHAFADSHITINSAVITNSEGVEVINDFDGGVELSDKKPLSEEIKGQEVLDFINSSSGLSTLYVTLSGRTDFNEVDLSVSVESIEEIRDIEVVQHGSISSVDTSGYNLASIDFITGSLDPNEVVQLFTNWSSGNATFPDVDLNSFIGYVNNGSGQFKAYISPSATYLQKGNNLEIYNNDTSDWKVVCALESLDSIPVTEERTVSLVGDDIVVLPRQNGSSKYEKATITNSSSSLSSIIVKLNEVEEEKVSPGGSLQIDLLINLDEIEIRLVQDSEKPYIGLGAVLPANSQVDMTVDEGYVVTDLTVTFPYYNPENLTVRKLFLLSKNKTDSENEDLEDALNYYIPGKSYVVKVKDQKGQYQYVSVFKDKLIRSSSVGDEDFDENVENSPRPLQVLLKWLDWFLYEDENYLGLYEIIKSYGSSYSPEIIRSYVLNNSYESSDESDDVVNKINARPGSKKVEVEEVEVEVLAEGVTDSESEYYKGNVFNIIIDILKYML